MTLHDSQLTPTHEDFAGLNIGCGSNVVPGWTNCDRTFGSATFCIKRLIWPARFRRFKRGICLGMDARQRFPFDSNTIDYVYEQHMLYAFDLAEAKRFLRESFRVLKPGGRIRVNEDDLRAIVMDYLQGGQGLAEFANQSSYVRANAIQRGADALSAVAKKWRSCKWFYDAESLIGQLEDVGFKAVERRAFRQSRLPSIDLLEKDNRQSVLGQVWVEATKP